MACIALVLCNIIWCIMNIFLLVPGLGECVLYFIFFVVDLNRVGAQWCWQEQRAECAYAWSPGLQRPSSHTTVYGAHPQGTSRISLDIIIVRLVQHQS